VPLVRNRKRPRLTAVIASALTFVAVSLLAIACGGGATTGQQLTGDSNPPGMLPGQVVTEQGRAAANLYDITLVIATIVFILVEGLLIYITIRFRRRPTDTELPPQIHGSNPLEILWTIIPAITVTALFVAALVTLTNETEARSPNPAVTVDVEAFQWQWTFKYPDYPTTAGEPVSFTGAGTKGPELVLPVGETIRVRLSARDVIHSFYVPQFFYKRDVIPGRINEFDVKIDEAGTFGGQCAEFCGIGHANMFFTVRAVPRAEFDTWVAEQQAVVATPAPSAPSDAPAVDVSSVGVLAGFNPGDINAPADKPWVVNLTNADPAVPHDFSIHEALPDGSDWLGDPDAPGGGSATYQPPALPAGDYTFFCSLHPNMTGTLHVGR
jgi:cytochrome c oxidase subunit 2